MSTALASLVSTAERRRAPSLVACGVVLGATKLLLITRGYHKTRQLLATLTRPFPAAADAPMVLAETAARRVAIAGAFYPGRALCLEQSLTLYYLLRRRGIAVRFRLGAQAHPFTSHAWVEYQGQPVNDDLEHVKQFIPLPDDV